MADNSFPKGVDGRDAHLVFTGYDYEFVPPAGTKSKALMEKLNPVWTCALYAPGGVTDTYNHNWNAENIAHAVNTADEGVIKSVTTTLGGIVQDRVGSGSILASTAVAKAGATLSPNEVMIYRGTRGRMVTFQFELTPNDQADATEIKEIIKKFKLLSLPEYNSSGEWLAALTFPRIFKIQLFSGKYVGGKGKMTFSKNDDDITTWNFMACTEVTTSFSPGHQSLLFYPDGTPISISMTLTFQGIRPALREGEEVLT